MAIGLITQLKIPKWYSILTGKKYKKENGLLLKYELLVKNTAIQI